MMALRKKVNPVGKILESAKKARIDCKLQELFYSPRIVEVPGESPKVVSFCIAFFHTYSAFPIIFIFNSRRQSVKIARKITQ
jgi:hypothetical protein